MGDLMSLKIKDIIVHVIKSDLDIPFAFSQGWVKKKICNTCRDKN